MLQYVCIEVMREVHFICVTLHLSSASQQYFYIARYNYVGKGSYLWLACETTCMFICCVNQVGPLHVLAYLREVMAEVSEVHDAKLMMCK